MQWVSRLFASHYFSFPTLQSTDQVPSGLLPAVPRVNHLLAELVDDVASVTDVDVFTAVEHPSYSVLDQGLYQTVLAESCVCLETQF